MRLVFKKVHLVGSLKRDLTLTFFECCLLAGDLFTERASYSRVRRGLGVLIKIAVLLESCE